jgi:hypothetical protein
MSPYERLIGRLVAARLDRGELAVALRRVARGEVAAPVLGLRLAATRPQVEDAREELEVLAERLAGTAPIDPRGLALTRALLSDGAGPLLWARSEEDLRERLRQATAALDPAPKAEAIAGAGR